MNELFTEEDVNELAEKIYKGVEDKFQDLYYDSIQSYLYEHYVNASEQIQSSLMNKLVEDFVKDPKDYKFKKLRDKLFQENKEEITSTLTEAAIADTLSIVLNNYTHLSHPFHWKYKEGIVNFIVNNQELFEEDSWVQKSLLLKLRHKDAIIQNLKEQIKEWEELDED